MLAEKQISQDALMQHAQEILKSRFGHSEFLPGQKQSLESIFAGRNLLSVMPTGGGKSLLYQLPSIMMDGVTLVVSPLISLMKDQVDELTRKKIPAVYVNSSQSLDEQNERLYRCTTGEIKLLYVAPERFRSQAFIDILRNIKITRLAVDEAHCISEWGHDFRPDYRHLSKYREFMDNPLVTALTATATPRVQKDIIASLGLPSDSVDVHIHGFDRENLVLSVVEAFKEREKGEFVRGWITENKGSGIIYVGTRRAAVDVGESLRAIDKSVVVYHAGMDPNERTYAQDAFISSRARVVVATSAFGMGIDKPDVRFVIHYNYPGSVEQYYQEIGRAGRDGLTSHCVLLHSFADKRLREFFIDMSYPPPDLIGLVYRTLWSIDANPVAMTNKEIAKLVGNRIKDGQVGAAINLFNIAGLTRSIQRGRIVEKLVEKPPPFDRAPIDWQHYQMLRNIELDKLRAMQKFISTNDCRRGFILRYFGEMDSFKCGTCDRCNKPSFDDNASTSIVKTNPSIVLPVLLCIKHLRFPLGKGRLAQIVTGSRDADILQWEADKNPAYGIVFDSQFIVKDTIDNMIREGLIQRVPNSEYQVFELTQRGTQIADSIQLDKLLADSLTRKASGVRTEVRPKKYATGAIANEDNIRLAALKCISEIHEPIGVHKAAAILTGSKAKWIIPSGADKLDVYDTFDVTQEHAREAIIAAREKGYFRTIKIDNYPFLELTEKGQIALSEVDGSEVDGGKEQTIDNIIDSGDCKEPEKIIQKLMKADFQEAKELLKELDCINPEVVYNTIMSILNKTHNHKTHARLVWAVGELCGSLGLPFLIESASSENYNIRRLTASAIGKVVSSIQSDDYDIEDINNAKQALLRLSDSPEPQVRQYAKKSLKQFSVE